VHVRKRRRTPAVARGLLLTRTFFAVFLLSVTVLSCFWFEGPKVRVSGPYVLLNAYAGGDTRLAYEFGNGSSIGRVSHTVVGAGADENHVIVMRHPGGNAAVTEYYIIDRRRDGAHVDPSVCVIGPLDREAFSARRRAANVSPALDFTITF
jgi:hypothetical protein